MQVISHPAVLGLAAAILGTGAALCGFGALHREPLPALAPGTVYQVQGVPEEMQVTPLALRLQILFVPALCISGCGC